MQILNQLGDLFLSAVPTVIIVFFFYLFTRWSFFKPMERVLAERHKRAEGALQEAEASRAAVQEKLRVYNDTLKKARVEIFSEQEIVRRRVLDERQALINSARAAAQNELQAAKKALAEEVVAVQAQLETSGVALADEIAAAILADELVSPSGTRGGEAR